MEQNTYAPIINYNFPTSPYSEIRVSIQSGTVWFAIEDVCKATGIIPQHVTRNIDPTHQATFITYTGDDYNANEINMISFTRLQVVVARANTVQAKAFLSWVENEVMVIRDFGANADEADNTNDQPDQPVDMRTFSFKNSYDHAYDHDIRAIVNEDGAVWFVAKDVCDILDLANSRKAVSALDEDEKDTVTISDGIPGNPNKSIISESGLYALIFRSRKPEAKKFRKWVTAEVLPEIRKTGAYIPGQQESASPSIDPVPAPVAPAVSPKGITAFLQATTDTFWAVEKALNEYKAMERNLKKARKDTAVIIRSIKQAFPDSIESIDMLGGFDAPGLDVEMR